MFAKGSRNYILGVVTAEALVLGVAFAARMAWLWVLAALGLAVFGLVLWFFRDPERAIGHDVVSPADGKVLYARETNGVAELAIFMTPLDVHVNRAPLDGRLQEVAHRIGGHMPAFKKESDRNERIDYHFSTTKGRVGVRLIAGTVARRIHPYLDPGSEVKKGDRIGLIAFGSRCELSLPSTHYRLVVEPGTWVKAGVTTVAREVQ